MAIRELLQIESPILRRHSTKIARFDDAVSKLVDDMFDTIHAANGIGLAAPQIGISKRLIIIEIPDSEDYTHPGERFILCNPDIVKASRETAIGQEGCLSVTGYVGMVERTKQVIVRGQDLKGRKVRVKVEGFLARVFQHEIDHLNGVLYVDLAKEGSMMTVEEFEQTLQKEGAEGETTKGTIEPI